MQDISRQAVIALRWLPLVLVGAILAGVIAYTWSSGRPSQYEATGTLLVDPGREASIQDRTGATLAALSYAADMESPSFARSLIDKLDLDTTVDRLTARISVNADPNAEVALVGITVDSSDPEEAQTIAKAVGDEKIARVTDELITNDVRDVNTAIRKAENDLQRLRQRLRNLRGKANKTAEDFNEIRSLPGDIATLQQSIIQYRPFSGPYVRNLLEWVVRPQVPTEPAGPGPLYWTLLALVAGGMLAAGVAFVLEYLRHYNKVRDDRDLGRATGLPVVGSVSEKRGDIRRGHTHRLVMLRAPTSDAAEAYRGMLARIGFAGASARSLLVASASPSDDRSIVAANLALAYAEAGRNVVLVDADYRTPRLHAFFGVANDRGVTNLLVDSDIPLSWVVVPSGHARLRLMPAGPLPPRASGPLGPRQIQLMLSHLLQICDMVVINSPSISGNLDAAALATQAEESLLVVQAGSRVDDAAAAARVIEGANADVVGAVLYRQVRGSHRNTLSMPVVAAAPGQPAPSSPPPGPPRRIPAVVTGAGAPLPNAPSGGRPGAPPPTGAGAPGPEGPPPPGSVAGGPTPGPYATPFGVGDPPSDR